MPRDVTGLYREKRAANSRETCVAVSTDRQRGRARLPAGGIARSLGEEDHHCAAESWKEAVAEKLRILSEPNSR